MADVKIRDLAMSTEQCSIRGRVCRLWEARDFKNNDAVFALEMVLVDSPGDSIQAYVRKNLMLRFKPLIKEGEVYVLRDFKVGQPSVHYRVVPNNKRLYFNITTSIRAVTSTPGEIPQHALHFAPKDILADRVGNNTVLTDIIGCVLAFGPTTTVSTGPMREIDLENTTHGIMRLTLWGTLTSQFDIGPYEADNRPVIMAVTSTAIRKFKGQYSYASTTATRLYFNLETPEVTALSERFAAGYKGVKLLEDAGTVRVPLAEQAKLNRMTIAEILAMEWQGDKQTHLCTFVGEMIEIDDRYGWCYISCNNCSKKVIPRNGSFFCPVCSNECPYPVIRYKLNVRVTDYTGNTTVVIFNDDAEKLLKVPAITFSGRLSIGEKDTPREIASLIGKTFIFKIKVTDYNLKDGFENYIVTKIFEELEPVQKRKVEATSSIGDVVDLPPIGKTSSSPQMSLDPVTPEKKTVDGKKMKLDE